MTVLERIKLAMSSKKMELYIKHAKIPLKFYDVQLRGEESNVRMMYEDLKICCGSQIPQPITGEIVKREEMLPWLENKETGPLENTLTVFKRIRNVFQIKSFGVSINIDYYDTERIKQILAIPDFSEFFVLWMNGTKMMTIEELELVMGTLKDKRMLQIKMDVPLDFDHVNAFKFDDVLYMDARWVRVEHLLSLRNIRRVRLRKNVLTSADFNRFLKFWIECDYDMVSWMGIQLDDGLDENVLLDGIVVLKGFRFGNAYFLVAAKPTRTRERKIMCMFWNREKAIRFSAMKLDQKVKHFARGLTEAPWTEEYEVLEILNQNKRLKIELENCVNLLSNCSKDQDEDIFQKLTWKKEDVVNKIINSEDYLSKKKVYFDSGIPVFERS